MSGKFRESIDLVGQDSLKERLEYDPETGIFNWLIPPPRSAVGDIAGRPNTNGYLEVWLLSKRYLLHRLAFLYMDELRALLDAPACNECEDVGYHVTMGAQRSCWACKPAAQTQGEEFSAVGWSIDHTAGRPILVHNNCSVIEAEQAYGVLELIRKSAQPQGEPVARVEIGADRDAVMTITDDNWLRSLKARGIHQIVPLYAEQPAPFQARVKPWLLECFGEAIAADRQERNHRFLEEALELVQANQCTASEAHQLVDYVYGRPVGEPSQEVGGVMVTLAALCLATEIDMHAAGETELGRIWTKVDQIRAKQAAKPAMSPLPGVYPDREQPAPVAVITYQQVFKAYEYAESHPHKYLRGTTNWCAAVAHSLNIK